MRADNHRYQDVRDRVTYVVQPSTKLTAEPQLLSQNPVQIIHDVVEDDERAEIDERIFPQEDEEWQHADERDDVREITVDLFQRCVQCAFCTLSCTRCVPWDGASRRSAAASTLGRRTKKWFVSNGNSRPILANSHGISLVFHG